MPTLHNLLLPKLRYMGDDTGKLQLDLMREVYMTAILNLKMSRDRCPLPSAPSTPKTIKVGDLVLLKNYTRQNPFDSKYIPNYRVSSLVCGNAVDIQDPAGRVRRASIKDLQLMVPSEFFITHLPEAQTFGRKVKYINHPLTIPDLYKKADQLDSKRAEAARQKQQQAETLSKRAGKRQKDDIPNAKDNMQDGGHKYNLRSRNRSLSV